MNLAKKVTQVLLKDNKQLVIYDGLDGELIFKGDTFDKVWEHITCCDDVVVRVYEKDKPMLKKLPFATKSFLGFFHVANENYGYENVVDWSSSKYINSIIEPISKLYEEIANE